MITDERHRLLVTISTSVTFLELIVNSKYKLFVVYLCSRDTEKREKIETNRKRKITDIEKGGGAKKKKQLSCLKVPKCES